jgi:hypothetical protein
MSKQDTSDRARAAARFFWTPKNVNFISESVDASSRRDLLEIKDGDGDGLVDDGKASERPAEKKEPKAKKAKSPFSAGHKFDQAPTADQLNRASEVFKAFESGTALSQAADYQMRGGVLKNGKFTGFNSKTKQSNLNKLIKETNALRQSDPESFELARQFAVAAAFGAKDYASVPENVTVWRGHDANEELSSRGVNVTNKKEIADRFGASGIVSEYSLNKNDILFPLTSSAFDEGELIIEKPTKVMKKTNEYVSDYEMSRRKKATIKPGDAIKFKDGSSGVLVSQGIGLSMVVKLENGDIDYGVGLEQIEI